MQSRNFSLGLVLLTILAISLAGCAENSLTGIHATPTSTHRCAGNVSECPIIVTPTPVLAKQLSAHFNTMAEDPSYFTPGFPDGQDHVIVVVGAYYAPSVGIQ